MKAVPLHKNRGGPKPDGPQHAIGTPLPPAIGTPDPQAQTGGRKPYPEDGLTGRVEAVPPDARATSTFVSGHVRPRKGKST
jgi:hypothetical protein